MPTDPIVSTGRGGAGNIGPDPTVYTDGEIVREGVQGEPSHPGQEYSTGRGGAGNIGSSPRLAPSPAGAAEPAPPRKSQDVVPETAVRPGHENYHTGRGGGGNVHRAEFGGHSGPVEGKREGGGGGGGLGGKVRHLLHLDHGHKEKKEEGEEAAAKE